MRHLPQTGQTILSAYGPDGNRVAEIDAATGAVIREYVWLDGLPIAVLEGGQIYYVRADHIGRPIYATNGAGAKVWEASYLPFGGVHVSTGAPINLRFPGQWYQAESGLHQNWMRDYDPTTGRYIEPDPLGLIAGPSIYGYGLQNPLVIVDPDGRSPIGWVAKKVGGWVKKNIKVDGPSKGFLQHRNGRIFQVRWRSTPLFRVDFDEYRRGEGAELHCHVLGIEDAHIPLDPRRLWPW